MKRFIWGAIISFSDHSYVEWKYLGIDSEFNRKKWKVFVRAEKGADSIDESFETWDKPSMSTASHFIRNAIKNAKNLPK